MCIIEVTLYIKSLMDTEAVCDIQFNFILILLIIAQEDFSVATMKADFIYEEIIIFVFAVQCWWGWGLTFFFLYEGSD